MEEEGGRAGKQEGPINGDFHAVHHHRSLPRSRCFLISLYNNIATFLGRGLRQAHFLAAFSRSHGCGN